MPEFTTVALKEAKVQTSSGRQMRYLSEYIDYITSLAIGQAGRLSIEAEETPAAIRRRLSVTAKTLGIPVIIKRSGTDIYFWREDGGEEQQRAKRRYTRRGKVQEERTAPDQPGDELGMVEQGIPAEDSPELGQTEQVVEDAMRRVDPE